MKAALKGKMFWGLLGILAVGLCSLNAYALHYGETYDVLEFVDEANKAAAIGCAISIAAPMIAPGIPVVGQVIEAATAISPIAGAAVQGAMIGGVADLATGGDGTGALYGAASGAVFAGITDQGPVANNDFGGYMRNVATNAVASQVGKMTADIAVNNWGMSPESAQFLGMTASAGLSLTASSLRAKSELSAAKEAHYDAKSLGCVVGDFEATDFLSPSTNALSKMSLTDSVGLAATQAGIHVGVESAFKDKDWAPYVANFAGEALGTVGFAMAAEKLGNKEFGKVLDPGDPDDDKIEMGEAFRQQVWSDAVKTGIYVGAMDTLGGSLQTKQKYATIIANAGGQLYDNFRVNKDERSPLFTGEKTTDKLAEPLINAGAALAWEALLETHEMQKLQQKMHPAVFNYFTAKNVASVQALLGDKEHRAGIDAQMATVQDRVVDFGYDPGRFDGRPASDAGPVYNITQANSQLWNFSDLSGLTHTAAYIAEKGGDWRQQVTRSASSGPFAPYADRAKQVYSRAAAEGLTDITYAISNRVFENAKPIVQEFNPNAKSEDIKSLQKDIAGYPGRVRVGVEEKKNVPHFLRFDFRYAPDDPEPGQTGQVEGFLKDTPDLFVPVDSHYKGDDPDAPADLKDRADFTKEYGESLEQGWIFVPRARTGGGKVELIPRSKFDQDLSKFDK